MEKSVRLGNNTYTKIGMMQRLAWPLHRMTHKFIEYSFFFFIKIFLSMEKGRVHRQHPRQRCRDVKRRLLKEGILTSVTLAGYMNGRVGSEK